MAKKSTSSDSGILPLLILVGFLLCGSFFAVEHPLDAVFMTIGIVVFYCIALIVVGGLCLLFTYFLFLTFGDLYESFRMELTEEDREHLDRIIRDMRKSILNGLKQILPFGLLHREKQELPEDE